MNDTRHACVFLNCIFVYFEIIHDKLTKRLLCEKAGTPPPAVMLCQAIWAYDPGFISVEVLFLFIGKNLSD